MPCLQVRLSSILAKTLGEISVCMRSPARDSYCKPAGHGLAAILLGYTTSHKVIYCLSCQICSNHPNYVKLGVNNFVVKTDFYKLWD